MYYVYVLLGKVNGKRRFYIGSCSDLRKRLQKHKQGSVKTTKTYKNIKLVYYEACLVKRDALLREKRLKTGYGRAYIKRRIETHLKQAGIV